MPARKKAQATVELPPKPKVSKNPPFESLNLPPYAAWIAQDANRSRLQEILTDPVFLAASHYAMERLRVTAADLSGATAKLDCEIVRKAATQVGCTEHINLMKTFLVPAQSITAPEAWSHIQPEHR